jgi:hypothetical protein
MKVFGVINKTHQMSLLNALLNIKLSKQNKSDYIIKEFSTLGILVYKCVAERWSLHAYTLFVPSLLTNSQRLVDNLLQDC